MSKSFIPSTINLWNSLEIDIRHSKSINMFKQRIDKASEKAPLYFNFGNRHLNTLHTRLRYGCSILNADLYRINLVNSPSCSCSYPFENAYHYFFECPLYIDNRIIVFTNIYNLSPDITLTLLLNGSEILSDHDNSHLFSLVFHFMKRTGRFNTNT